MRFFIVLLALLLLPVFVGVHVMIHRSQHEPRLRDRVLEALQAAGIKQAQVRMDYLDATIFGSAPDVAARDQAAAAVGAVRGVRFSQAGNRIVVPAHVAAVLKEKRLALSGWLPDERSVQDYLKILREYRPDLELDAARLKVSPFVVTGDAENEPLSDTHRLLRPVLDAIRVPASLSVYRADDTFVVEGYLPSETLKNEIIDAVQDNAGQWKIDVTKLVATRHVAEAPFTRSRALPQFLKSYFAAPVPGTFSIDAGSDPVLIADATREMEAEWLALLRAVGGGARVDSRLTIFPSIYHLPGYRPQSQVVPGSLGPLKLALSSATTFFDEGSTSLGPEEESKLVAVAPLVLKCGPGLTLLVGFFRQGDVESTRRGERRAAAVKDKLIRSGVSSARLEVVQFGEALDESSDPLEQARIAGRIELKIK